MSKQIRATYMLEASCSCQGQRKVQKHEVAETLCVSQKMATFFVVQPL